MEEKYKNILEENDIDKDIFFKVLKKLGDVKSIEVKSSNGSSFVILSDEKENVYQIFKYDKIAKKIFNIFNYLSKNKYHKIKFECNFMYEYNLFDYLANLVSYIPENTIAWKKHICLNSFDKEKIKEIICNNITKLLWDIGICLYILHNIGVRHGDARIDNIGISNNKFILFDYDGSEMINDIYKNYKDLSDFIKSIKFNSDNKWKSIVKYIPLDSPSLYDFLDDIIYTEHKRSGKSYIEIFNKLNNMNINI